jgi:hypothetical protein
MANYFNSLPLRLQLEQLGVCEFMDQSEFINGIQALEGKKVVIVGCGAQGLNQGLNMRDSDWIFLMPYEQMQLLKKNFILQHLRSWFYRWNL